METGKEPDILHNFKTKEWAKKKEIKHRSWSRPIRPSQESHAVSALVLKFPPSSPKNAIGFFEVASSSPWSGKLRCHRLGRRSRAASISVAKVARNFFLFAASPPWSRKTCRLRVSLECRAVFALIAIACKLSFLFELPRLLEALHFELRCFWNAPPPPRSLDSGNWSRRSRYFLSRGGRVVSALVV